jgi:prepilin-type N-terminal cleavage/methylation domain-containing protein
MTGRRGFTLIEVLIALVILCVVVLGLGRFVGSFLHVVGTSTVKTVATEVAYSQINAVQTDVNYPLPASWAGNVTGFPGYPNMKQVTVLQRVAAGTSDYTVITVRVTEPTMSKATGGPDTVNLTSTVARP